MIDDKNNDKTVNETDDKAPVTTAAESIEKLQEKDGEANNESARTNEILAQRAGVDDDFDPIEASLKANDPSRSRSAYTSHESGFVEGLEPDDEDKPETDAKAERQSGAVNE